MSIECGTYTVTAGTGNKTISLADSGLTPVAVLLFATGQTAAGVAANARLGIGAATGATEAASVSGMSENNLGASLAGSSQHLNTEAFTLRQVGVAAVDIEADFVSFSVGEFVLNFNTNNITGMQLHYVAFSDDFEAKLVTPVRGDTAVVPFSKAFTGVGFEPDALIVFGAGGTGDDSDGQGDDTLMFGMSDGVTDWCWATHSNTGQGTSDTGRNQRTKFIDCFYLDPTAFRTTATVGSLDADGFTLDYTENNAHNRTFHVLALRHATKGMRVINDDSPATDITVSTACTFPPGAAIFGSWARPNDSTIKPNNRRTIGAWDGSNNISVASQDEDNVSITNSDSWVATDKCMQLPDPTVPSSVGDAVASANGNNLDLAWTNTDGSQRRWFGLVFEGEPAPAGGSGADEGAGAAIFNVPGMLT